MHYRSRFSILTLALFGLTAFIVACASGNVAPLQGTPLTTPTLNARAATAIVSAPGAGGMSVSLVSADGALNLTVGLPSVSASAGTRLTLYAAPGGIGGFSTGHRPESVRGRARCGVKERCFPDGSAGVARGSDAAGR